MNISQYLRPQQVKLGLCSGHLDDIDPEKDRTRELVRLKDEVVDELVALFGVSGQIRNTAKFTRDFLNRERSGTTAIGEGIALPHIRSMQPRRTVVVFARTQHGVWFDAIDAAPVHIFFGIAAPEYEDAHFYKFHKWISRAFVNEDWLRDALLWAADEHEIIKILGHLR